MDNLAVCNTCEPDSVPVCHIEGDDVQHASSHTSVDSMSGHTTFGVEDGGNKIHIVVVGGDIGALCSALAIADVEHVKVTMVNVGLGLEETSGHLRLDAEHRGLQLCTRTVSLLESLGVSVAPIQEGEDDTRSVVEKIPSGAIVKRFSLHRREPSAIHF